MFKFYGGYERLVRRLGLKCELKNGCVSRKLGVFVFTDWDGG